MNFQPAFLQLFRFFEVLNIAREPNPSICITQIKLSSHFLCRSIICWIVVNSFSFYVSFLIFVVLTICIFFKWSKVFTAHAFTLSTDCSTFSRPPLLSALTPRPPHAHVYIVYEIYFWRYFLLFHTHPSSQPCQC